MFFLRYCNQFVQIFLVLNLLATANSVHAKNNSTKNHKEIETNLEEDNSTLISRAKWFLYIRSELSRIFSKKNKNIDFAIENNGPFELLKQYKEFNSEQLLMAIKESFKIRQDRADAYDYNFGAEKIEPGQIIYAPLATYLPGQLRISVLDYFDGFKSVVKGNSYKFDENNKLWIPAFDNGKSVFDRHQAATGYLVKDEVSGKEFVLVDDGNHRVATSLLEAMDETFPVVIKEDLRHLPMADAYQRLIDDKSLYFALKGGEDHKLGHSERNKDQFKPATIFDLEDDIIRHIVSKLTAKFVVEMDSSNQHIQQMEAKSFNGPKVLIKVKVLKQKRDGTIAYMEFKVADLIYFALSGKSEILTEALGGAEQLKQWEAIFNDIPNSSDYLKAQQIISKILHVIWKQNGQKFDLPESIIEFNPKNLGIYFIPTLMVFDEVEVFRSNYSVIQKKVLKFASKVKGFSKSILNEANKLFKNTYDVKNHERYQAVIDALLFEESRHQEDQKLIDDFHDVIFNLMLDLRVNSKEQWTWINENEIRIKNVLSLNNFYRRKSDLEIKGIIENYFNLSSKNREGFLITEDWIKLAQSIEMLMVNTIYASVLDSDTETLFKISPFFPKYKIDELDKAKKWMSQLIGAQPKVSSPSKLTEVIEHFGNMCSRVLGLQ